MKKILSFQRRENGNISILILIMGLAVILLTTAMVGYIFHDIGFTKLDKEKLRALHFAESGISLMHLKIDEYYNDPLTTDPPTTPHVEEIEDSSGAVQGSFDVSYEFYDSSSAPYYIVTSAGTDKSGAERIVRVRINVILQSGSGIYDYVYTGQSARFGGNYKPSDGPFYTEGDLTLRGGSAILQEYNSGPIVIKGNLYMSGDTTLINLESLSVGGDVIMTGSAKIKGGQVNIAGNLTMSGGTFIDDGLVSPMIVMGDITMGGSAQIGEDGSELILSCHGTVDNKPWTPIYATRDDSLTYTFIDPQYDVDALIEEYWSDVEGSALIVDDNLTLEGYEDGTFTSYSESSGENSLSFTKDSDGKYILEVHGNVIIDGDLQIGGESWWPKSANITYYTGKGIIYTTGDIKTFTKLIPLNIDDFPENDLLVFVSNGRIEFNIFDYWDQPSCGDPNIYVVALAKEDIEIIRGTVRGTLIAGGILDIDNSFSKICYEEGVSENLPSDLPDSSSSSGDVPITSVEWQEVK